jgi:hypothetical protein
MFKNYSKNAYVFYNYSFQNVRKKNQKIKEKEEEYLKFNITSYYYTS